jgi:hypothetical protein
MNLTLLETGWLPQDDSLPWTINGVEVSPDTRTRREEYTFAAERCTNGWILDVASGYVPGWHELPAILTRKHAGRTVVALDADPRCLQMPAAPAVLRLTGDATRLPFPDATFDTVFCISALEHLQSLHQQQAAAEMVRVCRRRLIVTADEAPWLPVLFGFSVQPDTAPPPTELQPPVYGMVIEVVR